MSGMSITQKRVGQVRFLPPYTTVGQMAIIRKDRISELGHPARLKTRGIKIGYVMNTTGEFYVKQNLPLARAMPVTSVEQGFQALRSYAIDIFIHDAPTAWRIAEEPSLQDLFSLYHPLTKEQLAWAVSKTDSYTYNELSRIFAQWQQSGFIEAVLSEWIPVKIRVE
jgi:polar amino acid transport system substrate-binding protein